MTIFRPESASAPPTAVSSAVRTGYLLYVAWSASRGSRPLQKAASSFLQQAMILAIGLCFPSGRRQPAVSWGRRPVAVPSLSADRFLRIFHP
jgi:hypothetical protein